MDFTYTEEQEMVRELAATFAKNYVAPLSEQMDIDNTMPHHIVEKMAEKYNRDISSAKMVIEEGYYQLQKGGLI